MTGAPWGGFHDHHQVSLVRGGDDAGDHIAPLRGILERAGFIDHGDTINLALEQDRRGPHTARDRDDLRGEILRGEQAFVGDPVARADREDQQRLRTEGSEGPNDIDALAAAGQLRALGTDDGPWGDPGDAHRTVEDRVRVEDEQGDGGSSWVIVVTSTTPMG